MRYRKSYRILISVGLICYLLSACKESHQLSDTVNSRVFHGAVAHLLASNDQRAWNEIIKGSAVPLDQHGRVLLELWYVSGTLDHVTKSLRDSGYNIQSIKQNYERLTLWVDNVDAIQALAYIEGVSIVKFASSVDLLSMHGGLETNN
ncbi:hypothetical protein IMCC21906_02100 [Spongiibacter sp. IMCC21906]|uniref:hypothetical protein n=1 Tax=Spongiibacter sp. IMCC21906 TaxID=1620392 RepID=UPI00062DEA04|nr:hypothetical protein [Spongiibacter sp. IMCC21906]AKH69768.1 hypothetical protein IMCC21906_02100 [Spongiibacter sp. IMCC21906]